jgi:ribosomal protein S18 acetylase RimI-like enzyme
VSADSSTIDVSVLDNPVWHSAGGRDARLATSGRLARRFLGDVSPFGAIAQASDAAWAELHALSGDGVVIAVAGPPIVLPDGWQRVATLDGYQMIDRGTPSGQKPGSALEPTVPLGPADVPEMRELVALTNPGPFEARTIEFGGYVGVRSGGRLVAMAGERLHPPGWSEVSAVCTHPDFRGRGLAELVVRTVVARIHARGEGAFLHVVHDNPARRLYERVGFTTRIPITFSIIRTPGT